MHELKPRVLAGQLLVTGYRDEEPPRSYLDCLRRGERGGAILFKRNVGGTTDDVTRRTTAIRDAAPADLPPLIGVDQEGGRVARLTAPVLSLPAMRVLGDRGSLEDLAAAASALAQQLRALGFCTAFSPVLDVDSNPLNPVIGDRSFSSDAAEVSKRALAFADGLRRGGLLACGKHFPGHGDTEVDSHLALPIVRADRATLDARELAPFRAAAQADMAMMMTAHVVYEALDAEHPATLSSRVLGDLLRGTLAYRGVIVSDDLEMKALSQDIENTSVAAVAAGCDALLVCSDEALAARAHEALTSEIERSSAFRARCEDAVGRFLAMRRAWAAERSSHPQSFDALRLQHRDVELRLARFTETVP